MLGIRWIVMASVLSAMTVTTAHADAWPMQKVRTSLSFNDGLMRDLGLSVRDIRQREQKFNAHPLAMRFGDKYTFAGVDDQKAAADIEAHVFEHLLGPGITHRGGFDLSWKNGSLSLQRFVLAPAHKPRTFELRTRDGFVAFRADYAHFEVDAAKGKLQLFNLDLRVAKDLALRLGHPELQDMVVGTLELDARVEVPPDQMKLGTPPSCSDWSGQQDVALINIGSVGQWDRGGGMVAISPSATLKNVGSANVPWYHKWFPNPLMPPVPQPPYGNDQHPYLVWGVFRLADGRFEQIGVSDVKHAFYATNVNCEIGACKGTVKLGSILGLGCEDTYSQTNNQMPSTLSFRNEVTAGYGLWNHTGSHFDQNGDGMQDPGVGDGEGFLDHGALVLESDLQVMGAQYFLDAWYVVRDDVNIFNTMGWRQIVPAFNGSAWTFTLPTAYTTGSVLDAWVNSAAPPARSMNALVTLPEGHVRLAVKTIGLGGGHTRYEYALMNHDFDRQIGSFFIPTDGVSIDNLYFHDADGDAGNDWTATQDANGVTWTKPGAQGLDWGTLINFGFTARSAAITGSATLTAVEAGAPAMLAPATLVPSDLGVLFEDGFE